MVEGQLASYLRFIHVICICRANFMVCKKTVPSEGSHLKVIIKLKRRLNVCYLAQQRKGCLPLLYQFHTGLPLSFEQQFA